MKTPLQRWDVDSGVRERLFLLAKFGPAFDPSEWGFHPSGDYWYFCGEPRGHVRRGQTFRVTMNASDAVDEIKRMWNLSRIEALELIGFPEA